MSKVAMDRPRYVAFRVACAAPVSRRAVAEALDRGSRAAGLDPQAVRLTRFEHPYGIVRAPHDAAPRVRALLARLHPAAPGGGPASLETLSTAGTLRALTSRLGILAERAPG